MNNDIRDDCFDIDKLNIKFRRYRIKIITRDVFFRGNARSF